MQIILEQIFESSLGAWHGLLSSWAMFSVLGLVNVFLGMVLQPPGSYESTTHVKKTCHTFRPPPLSSHSVLPCSSISKGTPEAAVAWP